MGMLGYNNSSSTGSGNKMDHIDVKTKALMEKFFLDL